MKAKINTSVLHINSTSTSSAAPHHQHLHIISSTTTSAVPPHQRLPHHQHHQHLGEGNTVHLLVQLVPKDVGCVLNIFDPFYHYFLYSFTCFEYSQCFCCFFSQLFFLNFPTSFDWALLFSRASITSSCLLSNRDHQRKVKMIT